MIFSTESRVAASALSARKSCRTHKTRFFCDCTASGVVTSSRTLRGACGAIALGTVPALRTEDRSVARVAFNVSGVTQLAEESGAGWAVEAYGAVETVGSLFKAHPVCVTVSWTRSAHWIAATVFAVVARGAGEAQVVVLVEGVGANSPLLAGLAVSAILSTGFIIESASGTRDRGVHAIDIAVGSLRTGDAHPASCLLMERVVVTLSACAYTTPRAVEAPWALILEASDALTRVKPLTIHPDTLYRLSTQQLRILHQDRERALLKVCKCFR